MFGDDGLMVSLPIFWWTLRRRPIWGIRRCARILTISWLLSILIDWLLTETRLSIREWRWLIGCSTYPRPSPRHSTLQVWILGDCETIEK